MIYIDSGIANEMFIDVATIVSQLWVIFAVFFGITITFYIVRKILFLFILAKR